MPSISIPLAGLMTTGLTAAGIGGATAAGISAVAAPALVDAGIGAAGSALMGKSAGTGAEMGGLFGALGGASGLIGGGATGALNASAPMASLPGTSVQNGQLVSSGAASTGDLSGLQGPTIPAGALTQAAGSPLAQTAGRIAGGGSGSTNPLAILAALAQNANRPSTTAPASATANMPWNTSGYLNRTPTNAAPASGSYYNYGSTPEPQFYNGNQLHFAHGGALSRAMAMDKQRMAMGGPAFSTGGGDHYVQGDGDGQSDEVPAKLSDGEYVLTASDVSRIGQGSTEAGVKKLDQMRQHVAHDAGADRFQGKVKSPLQYLKKVA